MKRLIFIIMSTFFIQCQCSLFKNANDNFVNMCKFRPPAPIIENQAVYGGIGKTKKSYICKKY